MRKPRAKGDHGIDPTPKYCTRLFVRDEGRKACAEDGVPSEATGLIGPYLQRGHHLTLLFTVSQRIMVLHTYEGGKLVLDGIIY